MANKKLKVLAFGTYDLLHPGHVYHLEKASRYGQLYVVVARDTTVSRMKSKSAINSEKQRLANVSKLEFVYKAFLGNKKDVLGVIKKVNPDIICLGYDQIHFVDGLKKYIDDNNMKIKIIRFKKAHFPQIYKSSILREKMITNKGK
jgi:FAD synthetase